MAERLFGSDGARGPFDVTGEPGKINPETFEGLAFAYAGLVAEQTGEQPTVIVGGDTRTTTPELIAAVSRGAAAAGAEVWDIGVAPTPTIGWLAQKHGVNAIGITASHNPDKDNGFKPFEVGGVKPTRSVLDEVEARFWGRIGSGASLPTFDSDAVNKRPELAEMYLSAVIKKLGGEGVLDGKLVVVDGANGAASDLAPRLYHALGADVVRFACDPEGVINGGCGAAHLDGVKAFLAANPELREHPDFIGAFSNDGDADRIMGVDAEGNVVTGNHWMKLLARGQRGIVGTLYTNSGLREAVADMGVEFHECDNGDSHVTAMLHELTEQRGEGFTKGGEFTGHMIDTGYLPSGDGLYMGGLAAVDLAQNNQTLADTYHELKLWPEIMRPVGTNGANAKEIVNSERVQDAFATYSHRYRDAARIILRASGTEPVIRVWAEARQEADAQHIVDGLSAQVTLQTI